jgi:diguanylate cyclase (GGDEF)-like protein
VRSFRDVSIRRKLTIVITAAVQVFLAASVVAFVAFDRRSTRAALTREVAALADVVGSASGAALAFADAEAAHLTLESVRVRPNIVSARLFDTSGKALARYGLPGVTASGPGAEGAEFWGERLVVNRRIWYRGEFLGSVSLEADLSEMNARMLRFGATAVALFLVAGGAGLLLASRLQRVISLPILGLSEAARKVTRDHNYELRVARTGDDEIGALTDAFNEMLGQIHARDLALQAAQAELEAHVAQLQTEVFERERAQAELRHREEEYRHLAFHDPLTSLPNRALLHDRLEVALAHAARAKVRLAVLFLDVDRFKLVNDSMGHQVGDQLLQALAHRLRSCLREEDTLARVGGDEFVILLPHVAAASDPVTLAQRILVRLQEPFPGPGVELFVSASIGVSLHPDDGQDAETLLRNADAAMYRAKDKGRATYQLYEAQLHAKTLQRVALERELRQALQREELSLCFQPVLDIRTGQIVAAEALARWEHPGHSPVPPVDFIALAEETGLIFSLGSWALDAACREAASWPSQGLPGIRILVNVSSRQFLEEDILGHAKAVLARTRLDSARLELELTESVALHDVDMAMNKMKALHEIGVRLSIDDFGTGYSSLSYLRRFPLDTLKLDRSFVQELAEGGRNAAVAQAIVTLGRGLGVDVVAEGVETEAQQAAVRGLGCDLAQGFLFFKPLPAAELRDALRANARLTGPLRTPSRPPPADPSA